MKSPYARLFENVSIKIHQMKNLIDELETYNEKIDYIPNITVYVPTYQQLSMFVHQVEQLAINMNADLTEYITLLAMIEKEKTNENTR